MLLQLGFDLSQNLVARLRCVDIDQETGLTVVIHKGGCLSMIHRQALTDHRFLVIVSLIQLSAAGVAAIAPG